MKRNKLSLLQPKRKKQKNNKKKRNKNWLPKMYNKMLAPLQLKLKQNHP